MESRMFFLRDLKEVGILETKWLKGTENPMDMFTKNLGGGHRTINVPSHLWERTNTAKR